MKQTSPLESPKSLFTQPQGFKGLQVPKCSPNVIRNLGVNFEELMAVHSDPTSPNFQKVNEFLKSPSFQGSKPISMILPEVSQNSWMIPLQENCLETSMPFEDLIGQLESPKLSDKMQMIFNSNVNLSESIMKNTFRAVDESRVKLEDKDLQVELEISELKLHHLEKKVEGCLASSKTTLAMNAQLSQNVSRMVSPAKSSHTVLTANIRTRSNSRVNTPRGNNEDSLSPFHSQQFNGKREVLSMGKNRPKSVNQRIEDAQSEHSMKSFPITQNEREPYFTGEDNIPVRDAKEIQSEKISAAEKRAKSVSMSAQEPNPRLKDSIINEAYQKLNCYFGPGDTRKSQPDNQGEKRDGEIETIQTRDSHSPSKSTELIMSNNITFYTNMLEKEGNTDIEEPNKNMTRLQSHECLSEDQDQGQKQTFVFGSKPREPVTTPVAPLEPRIGMPREVPLVGADGKERIFMLKPKETLRVERLESIFIIPVGNKGSVLKPSKVRSQFSSFHCSETEECSQIKENLRNAQYDHTPSGNQTVVGSQSRVSFFDNSNIASMNLDRAEPKLSGFGAQNHHEPLGEANSSQNQKDAYLNNLKLQILNHPKCQKFFAKEDTLSTRGRIHDIMSKENDGMEFYFKQKINDFREFLNEFERILPTETSVSPGREPVTKQKKIKQVKSCEFQGLNTQEEIKKETGFENGNFESRTVENTPRGFENESHEHMKDKYNSSMKKSVSVIGCVAEKSPQTNDQKKKIKFVNLEGNEAETHYMSKANQESPFSISKMSFSSPKSGFNSPVQSLKKKSKVIKNFNQKESLQIPSMSVKLSKGNHSITIPTNQGVEKKRAHDKNNSMKIITQQVKNKKVNEIEMDKSAETKKKGKNLARGNSKSIVEAVTLNRIQNRANSVVVVEK